MTPGEGGAGPVRDVVVLGGGTAGWMAAATLSRLLTRCRVRLVESEEIGAVGVGEATIPALRNWMALIGLDEADMIRATGATFKLGIDFVDWRRPGSRYMHGFGRIGRDLLWLHTHQLWLKGAAAGEVRPLDHYALNCLAARADRFCKPDPRNPGSPMADLDYAYHFDASLFAALLRRRAEAQGVERLEGRVAGVERDGAGGVAALVLADGRRVAGELFLDCSGFRSLLLGGELGVGYEDWSRWLPCDRAIAVPSARTAPLAPYTRSTAHGAGWRWRIPLQHRTGNGIIYASALMSDDEAARVLLVGLDGEATAEPRAPIRFTPGRRLRAWEGNVVALGLAGGFLEPLESTSIHMVQTGLLRLLALFPARELRPADRDEYNRQTRAEYEDVRDFLIAHYHVTERDDTEFWRGCRTIKPPGALEARLNLFRCSARFFMHAQAELFREESWVQVLVGQGLAAQHDPVVDMLPDDERRRFLGDVEHTVADVAARMPDHAAFLAQQGLTATL